MDINIKVVIFGVGVYDFIVGGSGSGDVNEVYIVLLVEGLENVCIIIDVVLKEKYE